MKVQKILNITPNKIAQTTEIVECVRDKTISKGVSDKFKPARVLIKEKIKNFAEKTYNVARSGGEFFVYFMQEIGLSIVGLLASIYCAITVIPCAEKVTARYDLKDEMNKTILLDESDGGKEITEEEEIAFYDAVEFFNKEFPGLNWIFKKGSMRNSETTKDFVFSATKLESDGGIKITDEEKQQFEDLKTLKLQERENLRKIKKENKRKRLK